MADKQNDFTHVGVTTETQRKTAMLAKVLDVNIYSLVEVWANSEWESAKKAGLVTDAMLGTKKAHFAGSGIHEYTLPQDGKQLLKAVKVGQKDKGAKSARRAEGVRA